MNICFFPLLLLLISLSFRLVSRSGEILLIPASMACAILASLCSFYELSFPDPLSYESLFLQVERTLKRLAYSFSPAVPAAFFFHLRPFFRPPPHLMKSTLPFLFGDNCPVACACMA